MAPGRILQIFLRITIQNQIRIAQRVSSSTQPVSMLKWQALASYVMCDFCDTSLLIRFWTHSCRERAGACRGKAPPSCLRKTALPLKSPTGAFIATQTRSCRKVQNGEDLFPMKIFTAPQHIRSILPPIHPTKSSLRCVGGIFLFHK